MIVDCAVIGGGPAGLNAALVFGRARRKTILFDDKIIAAAEGSMAAISVIAALTEEKFNQDKQHA